MKQYLKSVVDNLIAPKPIFNTQLFSPFRVYNKRKNLSKCMKFWGYRTQNQLNMDIAKGYFQLREALTNKDEVLVLRNSSIDLYQKFKEDPSLFDLPDKISDIIILDCTKSKSQSQNVEWFQIYVKIKHFKFVRYYALERKIYIDNFKYQPPIARKWYFIELPLKNAQITE